MRPRCATQREVDLRLWSDQAILAGEGWDGAIEQAVQSADFGLLCVSPSFLASQYVTEVELPAFLSREQVVIPLALEPLDFARSDLKGLGERQVFRYRPHGSTRWLSFAECGGVNRKRFCDALVAQIVERFADRDIDG